MSRPWGQRTNQTCFHYKHAWFRIDTRVLETWMEMRLGRTSHDILFDRPEHKTFILWSQKVWLLVSLLVFLCWNSWDHQELYPLPHALLSRDFGRSPKSWMSARHNLSPGPILSPPISATRTWTMSLWPVGCVSLSSNRHRMHQLQSD